MSSAAMAVTSYSDVVSGEVGGRSHHPDREELFQPPPTSMTLVAALMLLDTPLELRPNEEDEIPRSDEHVFLVTRTYLQNWLQWAYHQPVQAQESTRVKVALRLAATMHKLTPLDSSAGFENPGPIDSTPLSVLGHPLLLRPHVVVGSPDGSKKDTPSPMVDDPPVAVEKSQSFSGSNENPMQSPVRNDTDYVGCCAVPEPFYELLRSVHGVLCSDMLSVSFQSFEGNKENNVALHHHVLISNLRSGLHANGHSNTKRTGGSFPQNPSTADQPRPIEFRRKVIFVRAHTPGPASGIQSPMSKLLQEEEFMSKKVFPAVELYPIKFLYSMISSDTDCSSPPTSPTRSTARTVVSSLPASPTAGSPRDTIDMSSTASSEMSLKKPDKLAGKSDRKKSDGAPGSPQQSHERPPLGNLRKPHGDGRMHLMPRTHGSDLQGPSGFVLVSRSSLIDDALQVVMKEVAPEKSSTCVRIWSRMDHSMKGQKDQAGVTCNGDSFEVVLPDSLGGELLPKGGESEAPEKPNMTVADWIRRQTGENAKVVNVIVETRAHPSTEWTREALELENRIQVGDFVDAQDTTGKWFEAVVREVTDDTVTVHYAGWSSRWDAKLRRRNNESVAGLKTKNVRAPAPLWTHTSRWRQNIRVGDSVEVREASSLVQRPRWFRGIIKAVGNERDPLRETVCGAELEVYEDEKKENMIPFLLLRRKQQVLVEVPQEKNNNALELASSAGPSSVGESNDESQQSRFLRWVNLYGEEICELGTHLQLDDNANRPATLNYLYDTRKPPVEVLKSYNGIHGAGFVRESLRGVPPAPGSVGLHNLGNSCFLNSVVQCLNHIEPLTQHFLKGTYSTELNKKNPLGSGGRVAVAFASLLNEMWGGEYSVLAPRLLKQTIGFFAPQFNNVYQHDSHEFCSYLMDGLHEDLNRVRNKPYVEELEGRGMEDKAAAVESWRKHLLRHDSIIVDHCQGMHRSHLTCPICGRESIKFDVYSTISLPLPPLKTDNIDIRECLEMFTAGEQLDERNAWYCPACKKHVCALKMIALWSVPDILILHLKRFTFNTCKASGGVVRSKIEDKVVFPIENLDMTEYILGPVDEEAPPVYKLFGVSEHSGSTATSGHYTATVRNSRDGMWYRYNDSHVGSTSGEASVTGGAYLLFYQRSKGSSRWAGMEKVMFCPDGLEDVDDDGFTQVKSKKKNRKKHR